MRGLLSTAITPDALTKAFKEIGDWVLDSTGIPPQRFFWVVVALVALYLLGRFNIISLNVGRRQKDRDN